MAAVANVAINLDSRGVPAKLKQIADRGKEVDRSLNGAAAASTRSAASFVKAGSSAAGAASKLKLFGAALSSALGPIGLVLSSLAGLSAAFQGFAQADKAAAAVRTLGVNSEQLQRQLLEVSNQTKGLVSQTELLKASYDVASAGFNDAASAATILKAATLGAVGGLSDLNTVADATTSVLNAYGLKSDKAAKIVDGFIQTQNDGKIVVAQYAQQIGRVAPIAAAAGVGIEDLNAAISAVTATGVPVESTFAGLRQAIASVIKPTEEARETSQLLGLEFSSAAIKTKGFGGFLADVIEKTGGSEVALTKLFGSVEAVATILPLANDGLEEFNTSLDNQKNSAGAAEKATEDLGGTVTSQVSSIINNIGNVTRALDTVLGPALKNILTNINDIISAASIAISKFTDLATGSVSRSAAALQALASTGFANEGAFTALKDAIGTLRPELANSNADLLKLEGALDEAGRAALRFGGKGDFGNLRNNVLDAITAMRQLIITRREALAKQGSGQVLETTTPDPEVAALQARINALLEQLNGGGGGTGGGGSAKPQKSIGQQVAELNEIVEVEGLISKARLAGNEILVAQYEAYKRQLEIQQRGLDPQLEELELKRNGIQLDEKLKELDNARLERLGQFLQGTKELVETQNDVVSNYQQETNLLEMQSQKGEAFVQKFKDINRLMMEGGLSFSEAFSRVEERTAAMASLNKEADMFQQALSGVGDILGNQLMNVFDGLINKTVDFNDVLRSTLSQVGRLLMTAGLNQLAGADGAGILSFLGFGTRANGGPVQGGQPYMVGERGPELFVPSSNGGVMRNEDMRQLMGRSPVSNAPAMNFTFETTNIGGQEFVSREQLEAAMAVTRRQAASDGAQRGMNMTLDKMQQSPATRRRVGIS